LLQIQEQSRNSLISLQTFANESFVKRSVFTCAMAIPSPIKKLNKANTFFYQFSGQQSLLAKDSSPGFVPYIS
jgi:hypothetical protein